MPKYNVTLPSGEQVQVEAKAGDSPETIERLAKVRQATGDAWPLRGVEERVKPLVEATIKRGLTDFPKAIADAAVLGGSRLPGMQGVFGMMPSEAIDQLIGGIPKGESFGERLAIETGAGALGGLGMGPAAASRGVNQALTARAGMIGGASAGAGGEIAASLNPDNPLSRVVGAVAGGFAGAPISYLSLGGSAGRRVNEAAKGIPDHKLVEGQNLMREAKQEGVNLNLAQAMPDQPNPLIALSEDAALSTSGPIHTAMQVAQTGQAKDAAEKLLGMFGLPDAKAAIPASVAQRTQQAATDAIKRAERLPAKVAEPEYSFKVERAQPKEVKALIDDIREEIERVGPTTQAGQFLEKEVLGRVIDRKNRSYIVDMKQLNTILKESKGSMDKPTLSTPGMEKFSAQQAREALDKTLGKFVRERQVDPKTGDLIYKQTHEDIIEPMRRSPLGQIAGPEGFDPEAPTKVDQIFRVLDSPNIRAQTISKLQVDLDKSAPGTFSQYARAALERKLEKAFGGKGQTPLDAPAAFAQAVWGGPGQTAARENFRATMAASARSMGKSPQEAAEFVKGAEKLMSVIEAAGRSKVIATQGAGRNKALDIATDVAKGTAYTPQAPGAASRIISNLLGQEEARRKVFDMLWTPEGVDQIRKYAQMDVGDIRAAFVSGALVPATGQGDK